MTPQTSGPRPGIHIIGGAGIATITVVGFFVVVPLLVPVGNPPFILSPGCP